MNYYKFISNGNVIDAVADPSWVTQDVRGNIVLCDISDAIGVVSSDMLNILHISGEREFSTGEYDDVAIADINEDEYEELKVLLNLGANIPNDSGDVSWDEPEDEPEEIVDATLEEVKQRHIQKLSNDCQQVIYAGIDVTLSDNLEHHFDLQIEDQLNLLTLTSLVASGEQAIPYHASNELCVFYSPEDITKIVEAATAFKIYHTSYFNSLKNWVLSLDTIAEVGAVSYGDAIPQEYCSDILIALMQSQEN